MSNLSAKTAEAALRDRHAAAPVGQCRASGDDALNFARYHAETAQPWELQALTRARVVAGDRALAERVEAGIWANLAARARWTRWGAIRAMRERIFKEHGSSVVWNLKHAPGALVEIEFASSTSSSPTPMPARACATPACARPWR